MKDAESKPESSAYPEFTAEGFTLPEGTKPNEDFEVVATLRAKEDGRLCLVAVEGMAVSIASTKPAVKESTEDPKEGMMKAMRGLYEGEAGE